VFDDVFRVEYPGLVRLLVPIVGSAEDAEAIAQDAFVGAYARWSRIGRYERPGAWVRRVAIRDAVRFDRRRRRRLPEGGRPRDPIDAVPDSLDLLAAIRRLPPRQRACVVMHDLADQSTANVAATLGCSESTVRVHLHRARATLADLLSADAPEVNGGR
jgi:RNA polymerase sigma-70 factor (ECF subfamily)